MDLEEAPSIATNTNGLLSTVNKIASEFDGNPNDIQFLKEFLQSRDFETLLKIHGTLKDATNISISPPSKALTLSHMVSYDLEYNQSHESKELFQLLTSVHMHSVVLAYDKIANKDYPPITVNPDELKKQDEDPFMVVRVDKENEPLGATVKSDIAGNILISRVIHGTVADRCGLLRVGDVIHEINGESVHGKTIDEIADQMLQLRGTIVFKLSPSQEDCRPRKRNTSVTYVKALFSYDPSEDFELPCPEAGLAFKSGDILTIFNKDDPHWWQASNEKQFRAGLIPSTRMREKSEYRSTLKNAASKPQIKKKAGKEYSPLDYEDQGGHELVTYEEVVMMKPQTLHPRPIVLIAPNCQPFSLHGVKSKLIRGNPQKFGEAMLHTSRPPQAHEQDGVNYHFITKEEMSRYLKISKFIDHVEFDGYHIGISINSITNVMISGKICVLTISPKVLKLVHFSSEVKPYVIFFKPPSEKRLIQEWFDKGVIQNSEMREVLKLTEEMETNYGQYVDETVEYDNVDYAVIQVQRIVQKMLTEPQWVPAIWSA